MLKLSITALILAGGMGVFGSAPLLAEEAKPADAKPAEAKPAEEKKSGDQPADAKKTAGPDYEVGLDGLWGKSWADAVKAALERLDGVKTVKLSKKNMKWFGELTMNDGKALDEETIKKAVADVAKKDGKDYKVTSFKALKAAPEVKEEKKDAKPDAGDAPKTEEKKDDKAAK